MIGEAIRLVHGDTRCLAGNFWRSNLVINAPPYVLGPGLPPVGPPGILFRLLIDPSEYIHKPEFTEYTAEPDPLLREKTRIFLIGAPILEIDFLMGDIPVAA